MKVSRPMFLNARLSVVCAWSNPPLSQELNASVSLPIIVPEYSAQESLQESFESEQYCILPHTDTPLRRVI